MRVTKRNNKPIVAVTSFTPDEWLVRLIADNMDRLPSLEDDHEYSFMPRIDPVSYVLTVEVREV